MPSTDVACYTWCTPAPLSIHQQHYLHASLSVVNVTILCKQPEAFSQHSVVAKRCRVTHYGYTTSIPPWLHYTTLDVFSFYAALGILRFTHRMWLLNAFQITLLEEIKPKVVWPCTQQPVYWVKGLTLFVYTNCPSANQLAAAQCICTGRRLAEYKMNIRMRKTGTSQVTLLVGAR